MAIFTFHIPSLPAEIYGRYFRFQLNWIYLSKNLYLPIGFLSVAAQRQYAT